LSSYFTKNFPPLNFLVELLEQGPSASVPIKFLHQLDFFFFFFPPCPPRRRKQPFPFAVFQHAFFNHPRVSQMSVIFLSWKAIFPFVFPDKTEGPRISPCQVPTGPSFLPSRVILRPVFFRNNLYHTPPPPPKQMAKLLCLFFFFCLNSFFCSWETGPTSPTSLSF